MPYLLGTTAGHLRDLISNEPEDLGLKTSYVPGILNAVEFQGAFGSSHSLRVLPSEGVSQDIAHTVQAMRQRRSRSFIFSPSLTKSATKVTL